MVKRPVIKLKRSVTGKITDLLKWLLLACMWGYSAINYSDLPETIPIHYNLKGEVDGYGSKVLIWLLPFIATLVLSFMSYLNNHPHLFNYHHRVNENNAEWHYRKATSLIRFLQLIIILFFLYINYDIINAARSGTSCLTPWIIGAFVFLMFFAVIRSVYSSVKGPESY